MPNYLAEVSLLKAKLDDRTIFIAGSGQSPDEPVM
jgi:hypothetical protein